MKCCDCSEPATWIRYNLFAADEPFCDIHAMEQSDFDDVESTCYDWHRVNPICVGDLLQHVARFA